MYFQMKSNFYNKTSQIKMIFDDAGLMKIQLTNNRPFFYFYIVF